MQLRNTMVFRIIFALALVQLTVVSSYQYGYQQNNGYSNNYHGVTPNHPPYGPQEDYEENYDDAITINLPPNTKIEVHEAPYDRYNGHSRYNGNTGVNGYNSPKQECYDSYGNTGFNGYNSPHHGFYGPYGNTGYNGYKGYNGYNEPQLWYGNQQNSQYNGFPQPGYGLEKPGQEYEQQNLNGPYDPTKFTGYPAYPEYYDNQYPQQDGNQQQNEPYDPTKFTGYPAYPEYYENQNPQQDGNQQKNEPYDPTKFTGYPAYPEYYENQYQQQDGNQQQNEPYDPTKFTGYPAYPEYYENQYPQQNGNQQLGYPPQQQPQQDVFIQQQENQEVFDPAQEYVPQQGLNQQQEFDQSYEFPQQEQQLQQPPEFFNQGFPQQEEFVEPSFVEQQPEPQQLNLYQENDPVETRQLIDTSSNEIDRIYQTAQAEMTQIDSQSNSETRSSKFLNNKYEVEGQGMVYGNHMQDIMETQDMDVNGVSSLLRFFRPWEQKPPPSGPTTAGLGGLSRPYESLPKPSAITKEPIQSSPLKNETLTSTLSSFLSRPKQSLSSLFEKVIDILDGDSSEGAATTAPIKKDKITAPKDIRDNRNIFGLLTKNRVPSKEVSQDRTSTPLNEENKDGSANKTEGKTVEDDALTMAVEKIVDKHINEKVAALPSESNIEHAVANAVNGVYSKESVIENELAPINSGSIATDVESISENVEKTEMPVDGALVSQFNSDNTLSHSSVEANGQKHISELENLELNESKEMETTSEEKVSPEKRFSGSDMDSLEHSIISETDNPSNEVVFKEANKNQANSASVAESVGQQIIDEPVTKLEDRDRKTFFDSSNQNTIDEADDSRGAVAYQIAHDEIARSNDENISQQHNTNIATHSNQPFNSPENEENINIPQEESLIGQLSSSDTSALQNQLTDVGEKVKQPFTGQENIEKIDIQLDFPDNRPSNDKLLASIDDKPPGEQVPENVVTKEHKFSNYNDQVIDHDVINFAGDNIENSIASLKHDESLHHGRENSETKEQVPESFVITPGEDNDNKKVIEIDNIAEENRISSDGNAGSSSYKIKHENTSEESVLSSGHEVLKDSANIKSIEKQSPTTQVNIEEVGSAISDKNSLDSNNATSNSLTDEDYTETVDSQENMHIKEKNLIDNKSKLLGNGKPTEGKETAAADEEDKTKSLDVQVTDDKTLIDSVNLEINSDNVDSGIQHVKEEITQSIQDELNESRDENKKESIDQVQEKLNESLFNNSPDDSETNISEVEILGLPKGVDVDEAQAHHDEGFTKGVKSDVLEISSDFSSVEKDVFEPNMELNSGIQDSNDVDFPSISEGKEYEEKDVEPLVEESSECNESKIKLQNDVPIDQEEKKAEEIEKQILISEEEVPKITDDFNILESGNEHNDQHNAFDIALPSITINIDNIDSAGTNVDRPEDSLEYKPIPIDNYLTDQNVYNEAALDTHKSEEGNYDVDTTNLPLGYGSLITEDKAADENILHNALSDTNLDFQYQPLLDGSTLIIGNSQNNGEETLYKDPYFEDPIIASVTQGNTFDNIVSDMESNRLDSPDNWSIVEEAKDELHDEGNAKTVYDWMIGHENDGKLSVIEDTSTTFQGLQNSDIHPADIIFYIPPENDERDYLSAFEQVNAPRPYTVENTYNGAQDFEFIRVDDPDAYSNCLMEADRQVREQASRNAASGNQCIVGAEAVGRAGRGQANQDLQNDYETSKNQNRADAERLEMCASSQFELCVDERQQIQNTVNAAGAAANNDVAASRAAQLEQSQALSACRAQIEENNRVLRNYSDQAVLACKNQQLFV